MSSDGMLRFEESNYDDLVDKFIQRYRGKWEDFVMEEYTDDYANSMDHTKAEEIKTEFKKYMGGSNETRKPIT